MNVEIHIPVIQVEQVEDKRVSDRTTIEAHTETTLVIREDVTANPNFDYYLQPVGDLLYDYTGSGDFAYGGTKFNRTTDDAWLEFDCYPDQLRTAAQQRASEDWCHEVQVLAEWTHRAESGEHDNLARRLQTALDEASEESPDAEYRKEIGGGADLMEDTTDGSLGGGE